MIGVPRAVKPVGRITTGDHLCLVFNSDAEQREIMTTFVLAGLARGEKVVYVSDHTTPEALHAWLRARDVDARPAWARGQLELRTATSEYLTDGRFDPQAVRSQARSDLDESLSAGFTGLRSTAEMSWTLHGYPGSERIAEHEQLLDGAATAGMTGVCQYDRRLFPPDVLASRRAAHRQEVVADPLHDDGTLRVTPSFEPHGLTIAGSVDALNCDVLAVLLAQWEAREAGDLHLELSALDFIDVAGLRVLVKAAEGLRGRKLCLINLAPALCRVVRLIGWDTTPNMVLSAKVVSE